MVNEQIQMRAAQDVLAFMCDRCDIYNTTNVTKENHSTFKQFEMVQRDVPCRLSFSYVSRSYATTTADQVRQTLKLFLPPQIVVKPMTLYLFNTRKELIIIPAALGNDAGIIGACQ